MDGWVAELVPSVVGIVASPIPIAVAITLLLAERSRIVGVGYLLGWITAILAWTLAFSGIALWAGIDADQLRVVVAVAQAAIGAVGVAIGLVLLIRRPRARGGRSWTASLDRMNLPGAIGVGFGMGALNPKLAALAALAGLSLAAHEATVPVVGAAALFAVVAALGVGIPMLIRLSAAQSSTRLLRRLRVWLTSRESLVAGLVFLVVGAYFLIDTALGIIRAKS